MNNLIVLLFAFGATALAQSNLYAPLDGSFLTTLDTMTGKQSIVADFPGYQSAIVPTTTGNIFILPSTGLYDGGAVTVFNTKTRKRVPLNTTYSYDGGGLAVSPDGSLVFVGTCRLGLNGCSSYYIEELQSPNWTEVGLASVPAYGALAVSPSGQTLYVSEYQSNVNFAGEAVPGLAAFSVPSLTPGAVVPNALGPFVVNSAGTAAYVATYDSLSMKSHVLAVDLTTMQSTNQITLPSPVDNPSIALSQDGSLLGINDFGYLFFLDTSTLTITGTVSTAPITVFGGDNGGNSAPGGLVLDGTNAYVGDDISGFVYEVSSLSNSITRSLPAGAPEYVTALKTPGIPYVLQYENSSLGVFPEGTTVPSQVLPISIVLIDPSGSESPLGLSDNGAFIYLTNSLGVNEYQVSDGAFVRSYLSGMSANGAVASPDGSTLYISAGGLFQQYLYKVDAVSGAILSSAAFPQNVYALSLAMSPTGNKICVVLADQVHLPDPVAIYDTSSGVIADTDIQSGQYCAIDPTGSFAYVVPNYSGSNSGFYVVDLASNKSRLVDSGVHLGPIAFLQSGGVAYSAGAIGYDDQTIVSINTVSHSLTPIAATQSTFGSIAVTADGNYVYATGSPYSVAVDTMGGKIIGHPLINGEVVSH